MAANRVMCASVAPRRMYHQLHTAPITVCQRLLCTALVIAPVAMRAQTGAATLTGRVTDTTGVGVVGAVLQATATGVGTTADASGRYRLNNIPAGTATIAVRSPGYAPETVLVQLAPGERGKRDFVLRPQAVRLGEVMIHASPRLAGTKAAALQLQQNADNLINVLSGDEIRSLPNFNAAEAAGRIPGVSLERDEGEGKFVQVRGTEPRLSNVTIDGAHVPGTEADRIPKLDDVPSDLLAAIQVSKTLTADMDADAIGGSVNLITKTPEGRPRGYLAAQYGQISLLNRNTYQGSLTYGGRFGPDGKLGVLFGGSADKNNRAINDVEPAWGVYDSGGGSVSAPNEWSQRDYLYDRSRYGVAGDVDYRFDDNNSVYVKGLWSLFHNYGTRYVYDLSGDASPVSSTSGTIPDVGIERTSQFRTPSEQMWGGTAGGRHDFGPAILDYALNYAGTVQENNNYRTSTFGYTGPDMTIDYNTSDVTYPKYHYESPNDSLSAMDASNYSLDKFSTSDHRTTGRDLGGGANVIVPWRLAEHPSDFKVGFRYRDEKKVFTNKEEEFTDTSSTPTTLAEVLSSFSDPTYYHYLARGFTITPAINNDAVNAYEDANMGRLQNTSDPLADSLGSFDGSEKIYAGYIMNTSDIGQLRVNLGLRVEATHATYLGHSVSQAVDSAGNPIGDPVLQTVSGTRDYTDFFPSAQLRYAVDQQTNIRLAFTRGIARPNYPDLAPNQSGSICNTCANNPDLSGFTTGNPDLRAQHAWNYDLLFEHYLKTIGVISGGLFYKDLSDVILTRRFTYTGPGPFHGYVGLAPDNGGHGYLVGQEVAWVQRFVFLPGSLSGFGVDANYTHTSSSVVVDPETGRKAQLLRQSPNIANAYLTYDHGRFLGRIGWTYNGQMITSYGDGSSTATGDGYFYPHSQIDGSLIFNATRAVALQLMVLNINNAVFGFYQGTPGHEFNIQREYYGQTYFLGTRIGF